MIKDRPLFISLLCFYLLIYGCYDLFTSFSSLKDPDVQAAMAQTGLPFPVQVTMIYLNILITMGCAIYMMQEVNWARWVYLGWGFIHIDNLLYIEKSWQDNIIFIAIYLVSAVVLLVPSANKYFSSGFDLD
jgi:hypothetical protein